MTLNWDKPSNTILNGDVTAYDIRFKPSGWWIGGYYVTSVKAPATSVLITGKSGFNALLTYEFKVRARCDDWKGEWSKVVESIGMSTYVAVPGRNQTLFRCII